MSNSRSSGGIGLCGALFITFVVLRLTDNIDWAWYWVASPLWVPAAILLAICAVVLIVACVGGFITGVIKGWLRNRKRERVPR